MKEPQNSTNATDEFKSFIGFFLKERGDDPGPFELNPVQADGSKRSFWRVVSRLSDLTFIAMANEPLDELTRRENFSYLMIGRHLKNRHLPLPRIYASDLDRGWFIMQDFGKVNLQEVAASCGDKVPLYRRVVDILFRLQVEGSKGFQPSWTCQTERYDWTVMRRYEADYFREAFLGDYLGLKKEWLELESPLNHLAGEASRSEDCFFLHRDFQSRNIMVQGETIGIVDWQGGRLGPLAYDLASLIIDPYAGLTTQERDLVYKEYTGLLSESFPERVNAFKRSFPYLALQRNLQILGAFSFLSRVRKRTHFEQYIFPALVSLRGLLDAAKDEALSPLTELVASIHDAMAEAHRERLVVQGSQQEARGTL